VTDASRQDTFERTFWGGFSPDIYLPNRKNQFKKLSE
jgi:hypothetical protein